MSRAAIAVCDDIRGQIGALGVSEAKPDREIHDIRSRQERQEAEVRSLQVALQGIVTQYELDKLVGLNKESPFLVIYSDNMNNELQRLQAMGLIQNPEGVGIWTIRNYHKDRAEAFEAVWA